MPYNPFNGHFTSDADIIASRASGARQNVMPLSSFVALIRNNDVTALRGGNGNSAILAQHLRDADSSLSALSLAKSALRAEIDKLVARGTETVWSEKIASTVPALRRILATLERV